MRNRYEPLHQLIIRNCSSEGEDKIYFISEATKGMDYWVTKFNSRPNSFSENWTWSLVEPQFEGDRWTNNSTSMSCNIYFCILLHHCICFSCRFAVLCYRPQVRTAWFFVLNCVCGYLDSTSSMQGLSSLIRALVFRVICTIQLCRPVY